MNISFVGDEEYQKFVLEQQRIMDAVQIVRETFRCKPIDAVRYILRFEPDCPFSVQIDDKTNGAEHSLSALGSTENQSLIVVELSSQLMIREARRCLGEQTAINYEVARAIIDFDAHFISSSLTSKANATIPLARFEGSFEKFLNVAKETLKRVKDIKKCLVRYRTNKNMSLVASLFQDRRNIALFLNLVDLKEVNIGMFWNKKIYDEALRLNN